MKQNFHEEFDQPELPLPPDRSTGLVFAAIAGIVAYFWRVNETVLFVALGIAAAFLVVSLLAPIILRPLNIAWMKFALLLNKVMNPIIMLFLFAIAIVPAGLLMQLRADPLRKRPPADGNSYWIERDASQNTSMVNQF